MDSGYYAAFAGLRAKTQALDLVANNLANVNTVGYKARNEFYQAVTASSDGRPLSPLNQAINDFGVLGGSVTDLAPGTLETTGNNLDLAIEGSGFFAVQTPQGIRYTRNGNFHLGPKDTLVTADGQTVLGQKNKPIQITGSPVSISTDGTLSASGAVIGRLRVVEFAPGTELTPEGDSDFSAPAKAAQPATHSSVRQGALESSNQNPITGAVDLISLQRHAEMLMRTLSIFNNDFNKTAAQELSRVV